MPYADTSTFRSVFDKHIDEKSEAAPSTPAHASLSDHPTDRNDHPTDHAEGPRGFAALGLPDALVRALAVAGIDTPFPIQAATVPDVLAGRDVLGRGQTGSGKTLAFGLPTLARLALSGRGRSSNSRGNRRGSDGTGADRPQPRSAPRRPRALILVPTRELAAQVTDALVPLGHTLGLFLTTVVGGAPYVKQIQALERGVDLLVATPGRLGDLIERGSCSLDAVEVTILDEADQMADLGFLPVVMQLLAQTPAGGQRLLFSATLDNDVQALVDRFLTDPVTHAVSPVTGAVDTMEHHLLYVPANEKSAITASIAARSGRTIMFVKTQLTVDRLVAELAAVGVRAGALHGGKTQRVRTRTLAEFREGTVDVLVATDVAARGIHVDDVSLVVHVDPPRDPKDYLHRAGRTARAGAAGTVLTLVLPSQRKSTAAMVARAGVEPEKLRVRTGDDALGALFGARKPSGVPVPVVREPVRPERSARSSTTSGRGRPKWTGRSGGTGRGEATGRVEAAAPPTSTRGRTRYGYGRRPASD